MEKNLGHATAYGYAKSKGYSGTEDEFAELMADYASVGQSAAQSAEQAAASATSASGSAATATQAAQTATSKASEAVTAAGTATTKASEANASADTASSAATSAGTSAQTATTAATTATTKASEASESATTATTAKTDAETARDAAAQSASEAAESARTLTIDATLTQSGQAADAKKTGDAVEKISSHFIDLDLISGFINGAFSGSNLKISYNATYLAIYFPVLSGKTYTIDKKMVTPYFRTAFSQSVPEIGTQLENYISVPVGAEYAQITAPYSGYCVVVITANASDHDYLRNNAVAYEGTYISSVTKKSANLVDISNIGNRVFYCGPTRDITTLKGGIEEATKYMDSTLYVDSGTYDLVQEFGQEWFDSLTAGATLSGLVLKNNIHVIFAPNSKVVSHYAGSNQYAQSLYSPFNAGEYGYTIENLNLECSRCRYAIHDERNGEDELYRATMINCKMSIDNSQNDYWSNHHCVGGGLGTNAEVTIKNCVFSTDEDTKRWGVYYHIQNSRTKTNYRTILVIKDNYFITGSISLDDVTATPASVSDDSEYIISNNSFPIKYAGTNDEGIFVGLTKSYALRAWNNKIRQTS